jgi:hypothetical protein
MEASAPHPGRQPPMIFGGWRRAWSAIAVVVRVLDIIAVEEHVQAAAVKSVAGERLGCDLIPLVVEPNGSAEDALRRSRSGGRVLSHNCRCAERVAADLSRRWQSGARVSDDCANGHAA